MNRKPLYIVAVVALLLITGLVLFIRSLGFGVSSSPNSGINTFPSPYPSTNDSTYTPGSTTKSSKFTVVLQDGSRLTVKDFLNDKETAADVVNPGLYYLAGSVGYCLANGTCPSGAHKDNFVITYYSQNSLFRIVLTAEPLRGARADAEAFLISKLGTEQQNLCGLRYVVSVPDSVNSVYSGKNLGFSFCRGATAL